MADEEHPSSSSSKKGKAVAEAATPRTTITFGVFPAASLMDSLASLSHVDFNPSHIAMVDITVRGLRVQVRNDDANVAAFLFFDSYDLLDFRCYEPLLPHMVSIDRIIDFLVDVSTYDTIIVSHLEGSSRVPRLSFHSESVPSKELKVDLMKVIAVPEKFSVKRFCEAPITSGILTKMIEHLRKEAQLVSVEVERELVSISIGVVEQSNYQETWYFDSDEVKIGRMKKHRAWFNMHKCCLESLMKASSLDSNPRICFLSQPENHIMMEFGLVGLGVLRFLFEAVRLETIPDPFGDDEFEDMELGDDAFEDSDLDG